MTLHFTHTNITEDEKEVIDDLNHCLKIQEQGNFNYDVNDDLIQSFLTEYSRMKEAEGWISVKERLPEFIEKDEIAYFLTTDKYGGCGMLRWDQHNKRWWDSEERTYTDAFDGLITHWKPLPKAPPNQ